MAPHTAPTPPTEPTQQSAGSTLSPVTATASPLLTVERASDLRSQVAAWRRQGQTIAFVPTMGALHEGHLSLVRRGRRLADRVVVSIFVNPTQFGADEDLDAYPRNDSQDAALLAAEGCDLLFLPAVDTIYPPGHSTLVEVEGPSRGFEGAQRPGHFRGVATVVTQLLNLVQPELAIFGQKDAQQLAVVRQLVRDLHLPVEIVSGPIVREADGLAMSSRNVYLDGAQRQAATVLFRALSDLESRLRRGTETPGPNGLRRAAEIQRFIARQIETEPLAELDYVAVVDAATFQPVAVAAGEIVVALAVRFGCTRLLDNLPLSLDESV